MTRVVASRAHYAAHLAPVAAALGPDAPVTLVASYQDHRAARGAPGAIVAMEHGIGQSYGTDHPAYPGGRDRDDAALFLAPNEHAARRWRERYPRIPAVAIGSPRLDALPFPGTSAESTGDPVVAISWHWPCMAGRPWSGWAFPEYRDAVLELSRHVKVLGHGHPRAMPSLAAWYERHGIEVVRDFDEVCRRAHVYVCDNSSTLYEFASTGRPVVLMNSREWLAAPGPGLRFWDAAHVGVNVQRPRDLADAVDRALLDTAEDRAAREDALSVAYAHRTGATARAVEAIAEHVGVAA